MPGLETDVKTQLVELAGGAIEAFCEDMSMTFGLEMACRVQQGGDETLATLAKRYPKLVALHAVKADGALNGTFHLILDQKGLFTLAGVVAMLPAEKINENGEAGKKENSEQMRDAVQNAGNLLVGAFDRTFRELVQGHGRFTGTTTFIGELQGAAQEQTGIAADERLLLAEYEITVNSFAPFRCGVVFPQSLVAQGEVLTVTVRSDAQGAEPPPQIQFSQAGEATQAGAANELPSGPALSAASGLTAADIMDSEVVWADPGDSVGQVIETMQQRNVGYVMAGRDSVLQGIISRSNITGAISPFLRPIFARWHRAIDDASLRIRARWVMTAPVHTVAPDAGVDAVIDMMCQFGGRCVPVVGPDGKVQGIITSFDIFKALTKGRQNQSAAGRPIQPPLL